jgi:hypothetical protein
MEFLLGFVYNHLVDKNSHKTIDGFTNYWEK